MAVEFMDSVEHYVTAGITQKWTSIGGGTVSVAANGPGGRPNIQVGSSANSYVQKTVPANVTYGVCFLYSVSNNSGFATAEQITLMEGATRHLDVRTVNVSGTLTNLRVTLNGTTIATGSTNLAVNPNFYWVTFLATINDTTGSYELRIDNNVELSGSGIDTRNGGTSGAIDTIRLGNIASRAAGNQRFNDIIFTSGSTGITTPQRITYLPANGAGNQNDFTPTSGSNFQMVDETTSDEATTVNTSSTVGHKDLLALADLPTPANSVYAIQSVTRLRKDDAGSRTARHLVRTGGSDFESSDITPTTSFATYYDIRTQNPNTSADWGVSDPNNLQAGYKVQA